MVRQSVDCTKVTTFGKGIMVTLYRVGVSCVAPLYFFAASCRLMCAIGHSSSAAFLLSRWQGVFHGFGLGSKMTKESCLLTNVTIFEDKQGKRFFERKVQLLVHPESSVKTVERINVHLRTTYGVRQGVRLRVTSEMWDRTAKQAHIDAVDASELRRFVVQFDDEKCMPVWQDPEF